MNTEAGYSSANEGKWNTHMDHCDTVGGGEGQS